MQMTTAENIKRFSDVTTELVKVHQQHIEAVIEITKKHGIFASLFYKFLAIGYAIQIQMLEKQLREIKDELQTSSPNT